jgi:sialidase-1
MINSRLNNPGYRQVHVSYDEGSTWQSRADSTLTDPGCNASIIRYPVIKDGQKVNYLLFSNANMKDARMNMYVRISYDDGKTWSKGKSIYPGGSAYSSLTILANGDIGLLFEKDDYRENVFVSFSLDWLSHQ